MKTQSYSVVYRCGHEGTLAGVAGYGASVRSWAANTLCGQCWMEEGRRITAAADEKRRIRNAEEDAYWASHS